VSTGAEYTVGEKGSEDSDNPYELYPICTKNFVIGYAYSKELAEKWAALATRELMAAQDKGE